jgi:hypothetical protein
MNLYFERRVSLDPKLVTHLSDYCRFVISDECNREPFDICKTSLNKACFAAYAVILIFQTLHNITPGEILGHLLLMIGFVSIFFSRLLEENLGAKTQ